MTIDLLPTQPVGMVRNSVEVDSSSHDPDPTNNGDNAQTEVVRPGGSLPATGSQIAGIIGIAALLVAGGWLLVLAARRRHARSVV